MNNQCASDNSTVFVALSGGVDSSVAATLLKKEGYSVVGVYMKCWSDGAGYSATSCFEKDLEDARQVAQKIDIPFQVFDFEKEYKEKVMDYFFSEYEAGRTPNPDVECNREIKFGLFLNRALKMGADYIATGHYVRSQINADKEGFIFSIEADKRGFSLDEKEVRLLKGVDQKKDQSYFLWTLGQKELKKSLFPVGDLTKDEVRKKAKNLGLPTFNKPDSQGICFVGEIDVQEFLKENIGTNPGPILNHKGEKLGEHEGLYLYTLGQRQGLGIGGGIPFYVYKKDIEENALRVVPKKLEREYLYKRGLVASNLSWVAGEPDFSKNIEAKIRYLHPAQKCEIEKIDPDEIEVDFKNKQRAVTPGQSVVLYQDEMMLGGGIIKRPLD